MSTAVTITLKECVARLTALVGPEHAGVDGETVTVAPANAQQIAEISRFANTNGIAVMPVGNETKLDWGNPLDAGIRLDLRRMNTVREHAWQDLTCTVEAGCTWAAMQGELERHGQMVALDPLWPERATVGGVVATNDSGTLRLRYGGLRDLIIGMTVVLADGTIARTGGKVVKNVAGYDLHKLMTGSFGTLGVITEVNFRLHPKAVLTKTWTARAEDVTEFEGLLRSVLDSQLTPSSVQLRVGRSECALDIRIAAPAECMDAQEACLTKLCGKTELQESSESVWEARQELLDAPGTSVLKASILPADLCGAVIDVQRWATEKSVEVAIVAQATGLMMIAARANADATSNLIESLRTKLKPIHGSVVALRIPAELRGRIDVWGCETNSLPLMREIKRRFDPNRILNPGRFVGNI